MGNLYIEELLSGLKTGFIDHKKQSNEEYRPEILVNNPKSHVKVLTTIQRELKRCDGFWFSVAFATRSGVATIIDELVALRDKGIKGKILVSQYLNFTEPEALKSLIKFSNLEVKMVTKGGYHAKGYMFKHGENCNLIVGSSNFTATAFTTNKEWNLKISGTPDSYLIMRAEKEFQDEFKNAQKVDEDFIKSYEKVYNYEKKKIISLKKFDDISENEPAYSVFIPKGIEPNSMQEEALKSIENMRNSGKNKVLIISATGTGKTYLSAFDVREFKPKKFLFIVHRENIAKAAMKSYEKIIGKNNSFGMYTGNEKNKNADFLFSTVQTISKDEYMKEFKRDHFDYIVIDETHRAGGESYKKIFDYFTPKFLLGMTATPERSDGFNVFAQFDYNIAYEIRLQKALEEEMLSPFHYYGITDIYNEGNNEDLKDFKKLENRVTHIAEKSELYGCDDGKIKGLIFCSQVEECHMISEKLNEKGYRTVPLSGKDSELKREETIQKLEKGNIDYIITVDIFNEGIDIPKINQIIMLRPTQSAIVFIQQLGRGLRKTDGKDYLTVIDFIGNYDNNYMIPIALFGDKSYNKDNIRSVLTKGNAVIPGSSTISFDEISKEKIYSSLSKANLNNQKSLLEDLKLLEFRIGRIPTMVDFVVNNSRDPYTYVEQAKSYYNFLKSKKMVEYVFSEEKEELLELFSKNIGNGKRIQEIVLMQSLLEEGEINIKRVEEKLGYTEIKTDSETWDSIEMSLNFKFIKKEKKIMEFKREKGSFNLTEEFKKIIQDRKFRHHLEDIFNYSKLKFDSKFDKHKYCQGFILYEKYSRRDVIRILNWKKDMPGLNIGGYVIREDKKYCPIFVTYNKAIGIKESINYDNYFENRHILHWLSKSGRSLESKDVAAIRESKGKMLIPLFMKKNDEEGKEFYYMGNLDIIPESMKEGKMKDGSPVVNMKYRLVPEVEENLFEYLKG